MSADVHKEELKGEEPNEEGGSTLSVLPSRRKLLLGGAIVVVALVAYRLLSGSNDEGAAEDEGSTEIDIDGGSLSGRLSDLDEDISNSDESDVEVSEGEDKSFEEKQQAATEELHEDTPEYGGGE
jgi:hypothetical protein